MTNRPSIFDSPGAKAIMAFKPTPLKKSESGGMPEGSAAEGGLSGLAMTHDMARPTAQPLLKTLGEAWPPGAPPMPTQIWQEEESPPDQQLSPSSPRQTLPTHGMAMGGGASPLSKFFPFHADLPLMSDRLAKSGYEAGEVPWYEAHRGTPLFGHALEAERKHLAAHQEIDKKAPEWRKQRDDVWKRMEKNQAERRTALDAIPSEHQERAKVHQAHHAVKLDLEQKRLGWMASQHQLQKAMTGGVVYYAPSTQDEIIAKSLEYGPGGLNVTPGPTYRHSPWGGETAFSPSAQFGGPVILVDPEVARSLVPAAPAYMFHVPTVGWRG